MCSDLRSLVGLTSLPRAIERMFIARQLAKHWQGAQVAVLQSGTTTSVEMSWLARSSPQAFMINCDLRRT
jgi:hypothetical protein